MTSTDREAMLEKLRKLKAKADDPNITEEEAALYANKVAELLQQHNLSEAALEVKAETDEVTEDRMQNSKSGDPWAQQLAGAIAELYSATSICASMALLPKYASLASRTISPSPCP